MRVRERNKEFLLMCGIQADVLSVNQEELPAVPFKRNSGISGVKLPL
jgi:hypothetical protein